MTAEPALLSYIQAILSYRSLLPCSCLPRFRLQQKNKNGDLHHRSCHCLRYYMEILYGGFRGFSLLHVHITVQICRNGDTCENSICHFPVLSLQKPRVIYSALANLPASVIHSRSLRSASEGKCWHLLLFRPEPASEPPLCHR